MYSGHRFFSALQTAACLSFIILLTGISSCKKKEQWIDVDPAFAKYIEAYSTGIVSKTSAIRIQLSTDAATTHTVGQPVKEDLFDFTPSLKGKTVWLDARTIEFKA
ncbi:MAG TPA: hypothetical protein PLC48_11665, partial [Ferruginibacter sp.]|nr:hypothetical protein [Ferruginibacter sp.]